MDATYHQHRFRDGSEGEISGPAGTPECLDDHQWRCECGASEDEHMTKGHEGSEAHVQTLISDWGERQWEDLQTSIANGLAWAANEGMSYHFPRDDEALTIVRLLIEEWRSNHHAAPKIDWPTFTLPNGTVVEDRYLK